MTRLATGKNDRKQEILTPQCIIDVCLKVWDRIALDPCSAPASIVRAGVRTYEAGDGLSHPWVPKTFINCPYKDLRTWLEYGDKQPSEQIWLVPVRTHRKWWRGWRDSLDAYCELNPLKFIGYDSYFPAPLLLGYRGCYIDKFATASHALGSVYDYKCLHRI